MLFSYVLSDFVLYYYHPTIELTKFYAHSNSLLVLIASLKSKYNSNITLQIVTNHDGRFDGVKLLIIKSNFRIVVDII